MTENIYSSVPEESFSEDDTSMNYRKPIELFLKERKGSFFTAKEIAKELGYPTTSSQIDLRKAITILLTIDKVPIIGTAKGFSYAVNHHQMNFYADKLEERMLGLQRRIKAVREVSGMMTCD